MRALRAACALPCLLAAAALLAACGGGSGSGGAGQGGGADATSPSRPAPPPGSFPSARGHSLREVEKSAESGRGDVIITPEAQVFYKGENRYPFRLTERGGGGIDDAEVALYYSRVPTPRPGARSKRGNRGQRARAEKLAMDRRTAQGPFPAAIESLATEPAFRSTSTAEDPRSARVVYSTELNFPHSGEWRLAAIIHHEGEVLAATLPIVDVGEFKRVPRRGERAPRIHTPTVAGVNGDRARLTTRVPPETMNAADYADLLGRKPIVLLFASPKFCQSRVCGPVVDVAAQVQHETGGRAAFIHMEIYNDNDPAKHPRSQVRDFHLPSQPWLFTINRHGIVSAAIEGALGVKRMREAVDEVEAE